VVIFWLIIAVVAFVASNVLLELRRRAARRTSPQSTERFDVLWPVLKHYPAVLKLLVDMNGLKLGDFQGMLRAILHARTVTGADQRLSLLGVDGALSESFSGDVRRELIDMSVEDLQNLCAVLEAI